jgi:hypothetical protein
MAITIREALDEFVHVEFNKKTYEAIRNVNVNFINKNDESRYFYSGPYIGCYSIKYTYLDEENYFSSIYHTTPKEAKEALNKATTLNKSFKVSAEPINNYIFYSVHRFLTNKQLSKEEAIKYSLEALDYFTLRTLAIISSNYFVYPISENEAQSVYEHLNYKYTIKSMKNWIEYARYRSDSFLKSKFIDVLKNYNNDKELANAINDLFNRTKDMIKNIYREFMILHEQHQYMSSAQNVVTSIEGEDTITDRLHGPELYFQYLQSVLVEYTSFNKEELKELCRHIVKSVTKVSSDEVIKQFFTYYHSSKESHEECNAYIHLCLEVTIEYLFKNKYILKKQNDLVFIMSKVAGQVLYSRGEDLTISQAKEMGLNIIKKIKKNEHISDRYGTSLSNFLFIYLIVRAFTKTHYTS